MCYDSMLGCEVVVVTKDGLHVRGLLKAVERGALVVEEAEFEGLKVPWVIVRLNHVMLMEEARA